MTAQNRRGREGASAPFFKSSRPPFTSLPPPFRGGEYGRRKASPHLHLPDFGASPPLHLYLSYPFISLSPPLRSSPPIPPWEMNAPWGGVLSKQSWRQRGAVRLAEAPPGGERSPSVGCAWCGSRLRPLSLPRRAHAHENYSQLIDVARGLGCQRRSKSDPLSAVAPIVI